MSSSSAKVKTNWAYSLWTKSLAGFLLGFLSTMSLFIVIGFVLPLPRDVFLLIAVIGGFVLWSALLAWFYCMPSIKKPTLFCVASLLVTGLVNTWFYMQGGA
ncbi:hypothetical protein DXX93_02940 [Thalassotalea euphylliae]|uniref:DUF3649 domain-containing protein n=1 Tax=Thalassotalea euphylliae TaxID=1655234 RepID=A0A3E0TM91_9GAMM|nr:hypothetical protein [Thalassotalea euphylliae]REL25608.1 hypothetical protein DXX93_02940 [Thalassotalea euphylliae]